MNSLIGGRPIDAFAEPRSYFTRRDMLKSSALALLSLAIPSANYALRDQQPMTANGGTDPYPIPSLDKNGSPISRQSQPRTFTHLPFQGPRRPVQHLYGHRHRQSRESVRVWQPHNGLRRDARRVLGRTSSTSWKPGAGDGPPQRLTFPPLRQQQIF
jgi:hypothetical protein